MLPTSWREAKMLIIYTLNEEGKICHSFTPLIDGMISGPDELFDLLFYYLSNFQLDESTQILFIADGAKWIWNRLPRLLQSLGRQSKSCWRWLDFYHATEHLAKVASLCGWVATKRKAWLNRNRKRLLKGEVEEVIAEISRLLSNKPSKALRTELNYFKQHKHRMNYALMKEKAFPLGSGAIESAVRRVVNLKLKGNSIFWLKESANALLLLRSFFKSGRWELLSKMAFAPSLPHSE